MFKSFDLRLIRSCEHDTTTRRQLKLWRQPNRTISSSYIQAMIFIEEDIHESFDIESYTQQNQVKLMDYEFITKQEFNDRLDQMLGEY
jgi:hypothetical protein